MNRRAVGQRARVGVCRQREAVFYAGRFAQLARLVRLARAFSGFRFWNAPWPSPWRQGFSSIRFRGPVITITSGLAARTFQD